MASVPGPPVRLLDVCSVFGAPAGTPLHDFVRGGRWVPNIAQNNNVPTGLPIRLAQLAGATNYVPPTITGPNDVYWYGVNKRPPLKSSTDNGQTVNSQLPYSANWSRLTTNQGINCDNAANAGTNFYAYGGLYPGDDIRMDETWRLTISDGTSTIFKDVNFHFSAS